MGSVEAELIGKGCCQIGNVSEVELPDWQCLRGRVARLARFEEVGCQNGKLWQEKLPDWQ